MKRSIVFFLLNLAITLFAVGQQRTLTGKVSSAEEGPLPGVTVMVKGTTTGVITDIDGNYSISFSGSSGVLQFSFIGMETVDVPITASNVYDVVMQSTALGLQEFVVTALGISRDRKTLGYSVGQVGADEIIQSNETHVVAALTGKVPGVEVAATSGQVGSSAKIVIRGNSSFGNNQPLFVIDGIPFENNQLGGIRTQVYEGPGGDTGIDLDPNNIESISVLKGVAASALYGSRAAAGVVLVTTKKGAIGAPKINYNFKYGIDDFYEIPLQTSWAQGEFIGPDRQPNVPTYYDGENLKTSNSWGPRIADIPGAVNYGKDRWDVFQMGNKAEHNINISGGSNFINYFTSISRLDQQGLLDPIELNRTNILTRFNVNVTNWLSANVSMNYVNTNNQSLFEGMQGAYSFMNTFLYTPNTWNPYPVYDDNGAMRSFTNGNINNYLWVLDNTSMNNKRNRFIPTAGLEIKFLDNLVLSGRFGLDYFNNYQDKFADNTSKRAGQLGVFETQKDIFSNFNSDIMLNYNTAIGSKIRVDALIGHNAQYRESIRDIVRGSDFIISGFADMSNVKTKTPSTSTTIISSVGVYGQLVVDYNSLLYYTFTGRNDWVSTLSPDNRSYFYPSNSIGFIFSELFDSSVIGFGKLRLSHAMAGIPASPYQTYTKYVPASGGGLTFPYNGMNSYIMGGSAGNPGLQPEMTSETAMGLDMVFFNNRLGFEATIYNKISRNQMIYNSITAETGVTGTMMNVGELQNKGLELLVTATPVKAPSFNWDITASYSANRNKVIKISDNMTRVAQAWGLVLEEGHPFPSINLLHWVEDGQGNRLIWDNPTSALYGHWMRSDHVYNGYNKPVGKIEPDWFGSIRNTFTYKGLTLTGLVTMKFGGKVHNMNEQYLAPIGMSIKNETRSDDNLVVWPGVLGHLDADGNVVSTGIPNTIPTSYTRAFAGARGYRFDHELKMQPSDIIRLNELTLRYQLPKQVLDKIGYIKGMNISLTGNNIWRKMHEDFTGSDPDFSLTGNTSNSAGLTIWMFPAVKSYTASVAVNF